MGWRCEIEQLEEGHCVGRCRPLRRSACEEQLQKEVESDNKGGLEMKKTTHPCERNTTVDAVPMEMFCFPKKTRESM